MLRLTKVFLLLVVMTNIVSAKEFRKNEIADVELFEVLGSVLLFENDSDDNQNLYKHIANFEHFFNYVKGLSPIQSGQLFYNLDANGGKTLIMLSPADGIVAAISHEMGEFESLEKCEDERQRVFQQYVEAYYGTIQYDTVSLRGVEGFRSASYMRDQEKAIVLTCSDFNSQDRSYLYAEYGYTTIINKVLQQYDGFIDRLDKLRAHAKVDTKEIIEATFVSSQSTFEIKSLEIHSVDWLDAGIRIEKRFLDKLMNQWWKHLHDLGEIKAGMINQYTLASYNYSELPHLTCTQITWRANNLSGLTGKWTTHSLWHTDGLRGEKYELLVAREKSYDAVLEKVLTAGQCDENEILPYLVELKDIYR